MILSLNTLWSCVKDRILFIGKENNILSFTHTKTIYLSLVCKGI